MSKSIFKFASNDLKNLLAVYKPEQLLYAPIGVAKYNHSAMIVNLLGEVITPKFDFPYNLHGIDFLKNKLQSACDISHAKKLFLALESTGHFMTRRDIRIFYRDTRTLLRSLIALLVYRNTIIA